MSKAEDEVGAATPEVLTARGTPATRRTEEDRGSTGGCPARRGAATPLLLLSILLPLLLLSGNTLGQQPQRQSRQLAAAKKPARPGRAKTVTDLFNTSSCADPPYRCPYPRIEFYLYTRSTQEDPEKLDLLKDAGPALMETHFDAAHPTKVVIHGFGGGRKLSPSPDMRKAYFTRGEHNVIVVDYSSLVVEPCLKQVEWGPRFCALCIAQLIGWLDDAWRWSIKSLVSTNRVTRQAPTASRRRDFNGRPYYIDDEDYGDAEPEVPADDGGFGQRVAVQSVSRVADGAREVGGRARGAGGGTRRGEAREQVDVGAGGGNHHGGAIEVNEGDANVVSGGTLGTEGGAREQNTAAPRRLRLVGSPPVGVHVIGYSVGAHIAGLLANYVGERKIGRITGLDPTIIFYMGNNRSRDLDPSDALFVDVIHTGAGVLGQWGPNGHVDFYVNGGTSQPGCTGGIYETLACDHQKVTPYFIESITSPRGFWATPCSNLLLYLIGWCTSTDESKLIKMGEDVPHTARGIYYLETNARKPYAKGLPSDSTRRKRKGRG